MRIALAAFVVAMFTLGFVVSRPHGVTADEVTQMLVDNEIINDPAEEAEITDRSAYPHWVARTFMCAWITGQPLATCHWAPRAVYDDPDTCEATEWAAIDALIVRAHAIGQHFNARVKCVEEYNT